jgi:hypothetical protein
MQARMYLGLFAARSLAGRSGNLSEGVKFVVFTAPVAITGMDIPERFTKRSLQTGKLQSVAV